MPRSRWITLTAALVVACHTNDTPTEPESAQVAQAVVVGSDGKTTTEFVIELPQGVTDGTVALAASGAMLLADRTRVVDAEDTPGGIANAGTQTTELGCDSVVGNVVSEAAVLLRNRARVEGDVRSAGTIDKQQGAIVVGVEQPNAVLTPHTTATWSITVSGPDHGDLITEPDQTASATPGHYGQLVIRPRAQVRLTTGRYRFDSIEVDWGGKLELDDAQGSIEVVTNHLNFRGQMWSTTGGHPALLMGIAGATWANVETSFSGTIVAPDATLRLGFGGTTEQRGAFFASTIEVGPGTKVVHQPYSQLEVTDLWTVPPEQFGNFQQISAGTDRVLARVDGNVVAVTRDGSASKVLPTDTTGRIRLGTAASGFTVKTAGQAALYDAQGNALVQHSVEPGSHARPAPGSTVLFAPEVVSDATVLKYTHARYLFSGGSQSRFATPGLQVYRNAADHLLYSTFDELVRVTHAGVESWRLPLNLLTFEVSPNGERLVGVTRPPDSRLVVVDLETASVTEQATASGIWNLATSPNGRYAAATTRDVLYVFDGSALIRQKDLPFVYTNSMDISDSGHILLGGKLADGQVQVMLLAPSGGSSWSTTRLADTAAFRPRVRFLADGSAFVVSDRQGLSAFAITRS